MLGNEQPETPENRIQSVQDYINENTGYFFDGAKFLQQ